MGSSASLQPTSWTVKDVCKVLKAVGLEDYMELFVEHRVQGDVLFNLTEENLKEMEVDKIGDRLLIPISRRPSTSRSPAGSRARPPSPRPTRSSSSSRSHSAWPARSRQVGGDCTRC